MATEQLYSFVQAHTYNNCMFETNAEGAAYLKSILPNVVQQFGLVSAEVVQEEGPSGGWPDVEFIGNRAAIMKILRDYYREDDPEAMFDQYVTEE